MNREDLFKLNLKFKKIVSLIIKSNGKWED